MSSLHFRTSVFHSVEDVIKEMSEKALHITKTYFSHPLKAIDVEVPNVKSGYLYIKFQEPVKRWYTLRLLTTKSFKSAEFPSVEVYLKGYKAYSVILYVRNGVVTGLDVLYNTQPSGRDFVSVSKEDVLPNLAYLFTPIMIEETEGADLKTDNKELKDWFVEFIKEFKKSSKYVELLNQTDMYDVGEEINVIYYNVFEHDGIGKHEILRVSVFPHEVDINIDYREFICHSIYPIAGGRPFVVSSSNSIDATFIDIMNDIDRFARELSKVYLRVAFVSKYLNI